MSNKFFGRLGIFIIVLGAIGSIGIVSAFDWATWNDIKDYSFTYESEIAILKPQLTEVWITAISTFVGCLVLGAVLMALGKIVEQQEVNNEYLKMIYRIENKNKTSE